MLSSGQDKGVILDFLLDKTQRKFNSIVFVDDSIANINAMKNMLASDKYKTSIPFWFITRKWNQT